MIELPCTTFAGGLATSRPGTVALGVMLALLDQMVIVTEHDLDTAMATMFTAHGIQLEGASASPLAALTNEGDRIGGDTVGLVITGNWASAAEIQRTLAIAAATDDRHHPAHRRRGARRHRCPPPSADVLVADGRIAAWPPDLAGVDAASDRHERDGGRSRVRRPALARRPHAARVLGGGQRPAPGHHHGRHRQLWRRAAPLPPGARELPVAFVYDPAWGIEIDWTGFGEYAARLDGMGVNVAPLVAHGSIRHATIGLEQRPATGDEVAGMCRHSTPRSTRARSGCRQGSSTSPASGPRPVRSGRWSSGSAGAGAPTPRTCATAPRHTVRRPPRRSPPRPAPAPGSSSRTSVRARTPPTRPAARRWPRSLGAVAAGDPVGVDTFPEVWGPALLIDLVPAMGARGRAGRRGGPLHHAPPREHGSWRRSRRSPASSPGSPATPRSTSRRPPPARSAPGTSLTAIGEQRTTSIAETILDLLIEAGRDFRSVAIRHVYATDDDLASILDLSCCSIASDGVVTTGEGPACPLCWSASAYGYTARVLEHFVRSTGFFTLAEAVRRMTSLPAEQLGLRDRGTVAVGAHADLVVFDPAMVHDRSTPDDMARHPSGFDYVLVNGRIAVGPDGALGDRHGRLLQP